MQRENIGLAKLRDGTRLVRVGDALQGELAAWRYGETLARRRRRWLLRSVPVTIGGYGIYAIGMTAGMGVYFAYQAAYAAVALGTETIRARAPVIEAQTENGSRVRVRRGHLKHARLAVEGDGLELHLPPPATGRGVPGAEARPLVLRGTDARKALGRAMVDVNAEGASAGGIDQALEQIRRAGSAEDFLRSAAQRRLRVDGWSLPFPEVRKMTLREAFSGDVSRDGPPGVPPASPLALEMALHEETERRALDGELAMLEAMWREAEEIASIADRLPDVPAPDPPRLDTVR